MATLKEIFANALARTPEQTENINIVPLQIDENGQYDPAASAALDLRIKQAATPMTPKERLFTGRELTQDYQAINPDTGLAEMATVTNKKNGLLPDLVSGFQENYTQGFDVNNLVPQNKGLATKIGEGLGTLARFYDKPIGRMAVATGLAALTGNVNPMNEGITAYVGRQGNLTRDKAYRQNLVKMGFDEDKINSIPGIMTDSIYENLIKAKQLQEQQKYREMHLDNQQEQNKIMNEYRQAMLEREKEQDKFNRWSKGQDVALGWAKLEADKNKSPSSFSDVSKLRTEFTALAPVKNATEITRQYNNVSSLYAQYKQGKIGKNAFDQALITTLNKVLDPTSVVRESEFDRTSAGQAMWDKLGGYQQKLIKGGSGLTDANRADLVQALTIMKQANDNEVQNIVKDYTDLATRFGMRPEDVMPRHYRPTATTQASKYKEGQTATNPKTGERMIYRGGKWQKV